MRITYSHCILCLYSLRVDDTLGLYLVPRGFECIHFTWRFCRVFRRICWDTGLRVNGSDFPDRFNSGMTWSFAVYIPHKLQPRTRHFEYPIRNLIRNFHWFRLTRLPKAGRTIFSFSLCNCGRQWYHHKPKWQGDQFERHAQWLLCMFLSQPQARYRIDECPN